MKDRYLFKAKRLDNGEWEIGSLIALPTGEYEISNKCNNPPDCDPMWDKVVITHKVNPSTICQCTGLKDKNGKLIWENDVIKVCWQDNEAQCEEIAQVAWDEFGYYPWLDEYHCDGCDLFNEVLDIEVIGNIFDNPGLLESEE